MITMQDMKRVLQDEIAWHEERLSEVAVDYPGDDWRANAHQDRIEDLRRIEGQI